MQRSTAAAQSLFGGPGEMFERCRSFDWASTPLGPVEEWSQSLRTMATAVLHSRNPMLLFWGPDLIQIYNDAFRPSLGSETGPAARHPRGLGMSAREFWTDVWDVIGPQIEGVMNQGAAVWFEDVYLPIEKGNGVPEPAWWTYSYSPVRDDDGIISGTLVVCLETTRSVQGQQAIEFERRRLSDLFRHAPAFIAVLRGPEHIYELTNDNYQRLIGGRDVIGRPLRDALPEAERQGWIAVLDRVLATGEPFVASATPVEIANTPDSIDRRVLDFVYQPIVEADGTRSGIFVQGIDVTAIEEARAAAEAANQAKTEFLAMMSHELRTPLNAIDGYAELLLLGVHGDLSAEQTEDVERIRRSERHLLTLINELLTYTRIEGGHVDFANDLIDVDDIVAGCEALTAPQRAAKRLRYTYEPCSETARVRGDADRIRQILLNLIGNAIKFTDPGGSITVRCGADASHVHVAVVDTGRGIPEAQLGRIFEPFVQVDARYTRVSDGVGLGLAISRDLARGMGGELHARSREGAGSTFTLTLPRAH